MRNKIFIAFILPLLCFIHFPSFAQETITITTYYPAPYGVYRELEIITDGEEIQIGGDTNSPGIALRDTDGGTDIPYISFANSINGGGSDAEIVLIGDDSLAINNVRVGTIADGSVAGATDPLVFGTGANSQVHLPGCIQYSYTANSSVTALCPDGYTTTSSAAVATSGDYLCCQYQ